MKRGKPRRRKLSPDEAHYQQIKVPFVRVCMASVLPEWVIDDGDDRVPKVRPRKRKSGVTTGRGE